MSFEKEKTDNNPANSTVEISKLSKIYAAIEPMKNSRLGNYIVPGMVSHLIGGEGYGKVRLFSAERTTLEFITPHSHRFDFTCMVLYGQVTNTRFVVGNPVDDDCEEWCCSTVKPLKDGKFERVNENSIGFWTRKVEHWKASDIYSMAEYEIHSIKFERGTHVLFFEGPELSSTSCILEPWVDGKLVPTFRTESWMYEKS